MTSVIFFVCITHNGTFKNFPPIHFSIASYQLCFLVEFNILLNGTSYLFKPLVPTLCNNYHDKGDY